MGLIWAELCLKTLKGVLYLYQDCQVPPVIGGGWENNLPDSRWELLETGGGAFGGQAPQCGTVP